MRHWYVWGKATEALPLFNEVRRRAGVAEYTASQLTLDEILAERGREFAWEGLRSKTRFVSEHGEKPGI